jgi:hypothetical protein
LQKSNYGDAIRTFERPDPGDFGRDMAFLVGIIELQFRKFSSQSIQHAWKTFKSVSVGTDGSLTRSIRGGNDVRTSPVKIGLTVLQIRLVVLSSSSQHINR